MGEWLGAVNYQCLPSSGLGADVHRHAFTAMHRLLGVLHRKTNGLSFLWVPLWEYIMHAVVDTCVIVILEMFLTEAHMKTVL